MPTKRRAVRSKVFGTSLNDCIWGSHEWNLDIRNFVIYLTGEARDYSADDPGSEPGVEYQMSARLIKNLNILADLDPTRPILIQMKTCGGDWNEGMAIYDAINFARNPIVILNQTHARSMSSLIFQAADRRVMMPHSYFMFHEGTMSHDAHYKEFMSNAEWAKKEKLAMMDIYANRMKERGVYSKMSKVEIKKMLQDRMNRKSDVFLTPRQTVEWGLADHIFDGDWQKLVQRVKRNRK